MDVTVDEEDVLHVGRGQYSKKYTNDDLREAIEKVRNNEMSFGAASEIYKVPKTTLHNKIKKPENSPRGATTVLTKDQEKELAEWVLLYAECGDPRTKQDIIYAAGEIAELDTSAKYFKNGAPTTGWVEGFFKRHNNLSYRTPETISKASSVNTKEDLAGFFRNVYGYFERTNQLHLLGKPEHWWNTDETGFDQNVIPRKVVARKGAKRVLRREFGKPKENTTVTYAFSASGDYVEPLITFKDSTSTIAEIAFALGSVGANYGINQTDSGWAQSESFYYFVTMHLQKQWEQKKSPKPRILTFDGYKAHLSVKLFRWARLNDVVIIVLYPGSTPYLQMCDTTMFGPMKSKHALLYQQWRKNHPTKFMNDIEFVKILKQINDAVIKEESIINGWRGTGLQPFNFNNLNAEDLISKSPDRVYDFKGDWINPPIEQPAIGMPNYIDSEMYTHQAIPNAMYKDSLTFNTDEVENDSRRLPIIDLSHPFNQPPCLNNLRRSFVDQDSVYTPDAYDYEFRTRYRQVEIPESRSLTDHVSRTPTYDHSSTMDESRRQEEVISEDINFSVLNSSNGFFRCRYDTHFSLGAFGLTPETTGKATTKQGNGSKKIKLIEKIRHDVKELGLICAADDKEKLLNVLIINQQLDIIGQPEIEQLASENSTEPRTIKTILKPPTMPQRTKPKCKRNLKIAYGVVTSDEVIAEVEEREAFEAQQEIEREEDEIAKNEREKRIKEVEAEIRENRKQLNILKATNAAKNNEFAPKKKGRKKRNVKDDDPALEEDTERQQKIKEIDVQLQQYRDQLKTLKTNHVTANKAVSLKRQNNLLKKKEKGNLIVPTLPYGDNTNLSDTGSQGSQDIVTQMLTE